MHPENVPFVVTRVATPICHITGAYKQRKNDVIIVIITLNGSIAYRKSSIHQTYTDT